MRISSAFSRLMPTFECPICQSLISVENRDDAPHRPFCSERCKMVDLGRWLDGTYAVSEPLKPDDLPDADNGGE